MMGRLKSDQGQLFYEFQHGDAVPEDHLVCAWTERTRDQGLCPTGFDLRSILTPPGAKTPHLSRPVARAAPIARGRAF
jgi:hypothetical protein